MLISSCLDVMEALRSSELCSVKVMENGVKKKKREKIRTEEKRGIKKEK